MWSLFKKKYPVIVPAKNHKMSRGRVEPEVLAILDRLRRNGYKAYLVGGCIRDILLDKKAKDFDIVSDARPNQIKRLFKRCFLIGRRFRLAHVYVSHDRFVEVATFRALVDPEEVQGPRYAANNVFGTIEEDVLRRDFTVNALYFDSGDSSLVDYTGGLADLSKKALRCIGNPAERFAEDPVRIIRAGRFCAQLGFSLPRRELKAVNDCAHLIKEANANRLLEEVYKILRSGASARTFTNLNDWGLLKHWIPELTDTRHQSSLRTRLDAVDRRRARGEDISTSVLLTALLWDFIIEAVGEEAEKTNYQDVFISLQEKMQDMVQRLRLPRKEWDRICNTAARQWTFSRVNAGRRARRSEGNFIRSPYFADALLFFEILSGLPGGNAGSLKYWKDRAREPRDSAGSSDAALSPDAPAAHGGTQETESRETTGAPRRKRRRRRRPPRKIHQDPAPGPS